MAIDVVIAPPSGSGAAVRTVSRSAMQIIPPKKTDIHASGVVDAIAAASSHGVGVTIGSGLVKPQPPPVDQNLFNGD